jgi:hypothetical protein
MSASLMAMSESVAKLLDLLESLGVKAAGAEYGHEVRLC